MKTKRLFLKLFLIAAAAFVVATTASVGLPSSVAAAPTTKCFGASSETGECVATCPTTEPDCDKDPVFANCNSNADKKTLGNCKAGTNFIKEYINPIIKLLTFVVALAVVIGLIFGGIQYASSGGDPQKAALGKRHIRNAIFGLLLYLLLFAMIQFLVPGGVFTTN